MCSFIQAPVSQNCPLKLDKHEKGLNKLLEAVKIVRAYTSIPYASSNAVIVVTINPQLILSCTCVETTLCST